MDGEQAKSTFKPNYLVDKPFKVSIPTLPPKATKPVDVYTPSELLTHDEVFQRVSTWEGQVTEIQLTTDSHFASLTGLYGDRAAEFGSEEPVYLVHQQGDFLGRGLPGKPTPRFSKIITSIDARTGLVRSCFYTNK